MLDPVIVSGFMDEFQKISEAALLKEAVGGNIHASSGNRNFDPFNRAVGDDHLKQYMLDQSLQAKSPDVVMSGGALRSSASNRLPANPNAMPLGASGVGSVGKVVPQVPVAPKAAPIGMTPQVAAGRPHIPMAAKAALPAAAAKPGMLAGLAAKMRGAFSGLRPAFG